MLESMLFSKREIQRTPDLTLALLQAKDGFKELCFNKAVTKINSPLLSTSFGKFGSSSFNCISGYVGVGATSDFVFTKNDEFTIEQWQYINSFGSNCWFIAKGGNTNSCFKTASDNRAYLQTEGNSVSAVTTSIMAEKVWQHVAIVQKAGFIKVYINGVAKLSVAANANFGTLSALLSFGGGSLLKFSCNGYIDQMRLSRIARYSADFTPPSQPFVID